ncbi:hypothetical protein LOTGIDRAFT_163783 [Lottia gigantea]|uniref:Uncharacterized protein n=1 Tax=Lottia gigantea TaxID=225164 RepID=V4A7C0_LOTGI|nr:hypothetical protein LOTGIDRAFT_163783 [Lottia gigantea]ESO90895.1 hypothetical protein LOTGIDRAFT_163783 [Lottia gigantea]
MSETPDHGIGAGDRETFQQQTIDPCITNRSENINLLPVIHPEDSVSNTGMNNSSTNMTYQTVATSVNTDPAKSTISIMIYKSKQKEIELAAKSAALKEKNKMEAQKAEIQKQIEIEEAEEELTLASERLQRMKTKQNLREKQAELERKQSELENDANLEATKAITRVLYQKEDPVINFKEPLSIASFIPKQTTQSVKEILERKK